MAFVDLKPYTVCIALGYWPRWQIEHIAELIRDQWRQPAATGSPQQCAQRIRKEFP